MNSKQLTNALNNLFTGAAMGDEEALQDVANLFSWMDESQADPDSLSHVHHSASFEDAGILTNDDGLTVVLANEDGSEVALQITIVEARWEFK